MAVQTSLAAAGVLQMAVAPGLQLHAASTGDLEFHVHRLVHDIAVYHRNQELMTKYENNETRVNKLIESKDSVIFCSIR